MPESTLERLQLRGTPYFPKLQHYWKFTIRFSVISWTLAGRGVTPLNRDAVGVFYSLRRLGDTTEAYILRKSLLRIIIPTSLLNPNRNREHSEKNQNGFRRNRSTHTDFENSSKNLRSLSKEYRIYSPFRFFSPIHSISYTERRWSRHT